MAAALGAVGGFLAEYGTTIASVAATAYSAFNQPDAPRAPKLPKIDMPTQKNEPMTASRQDELAKRRRGRASTILTGGTSLGRANLNKKSILGA